MSESTFIEITGRLVQGDPWVPNTKNFTGGPLTDRAGNPKSETFIAIAVPKQPTGNAEAIYAAIYQKAQQDFPNGEYQQPGFSWKVEDGDAGKHAAKEWARGCIIFKMKSNWEVRCFDQNGQQLTDPRQLKRGYFVRVNVGVNGNGMPAGNNPGMYLNLGLVQLVGYGEEIAGGLSFEQTFPTPAVLPHGASATPIATGPALAVPGQPAPMVPGQPAPPAPAGPPGYALPAGTLPPGIAPQAAAVPPAAMPAPVPTSVGGLPAAIVAPAGIQGAPALGASVLSQSPPIGPPAPSVPVAAPAIPAAPGAPMPGTGASVPLGPVAAPIAPIAAPPGFMGGQPAAPVATAPPQHPSGFPFAGHDAQGRPLWTNPQGQHVAF